MSAISRVFGLQLCTLAVLLMLYLVKGFIYLFIAATKIRAVTDTGDRSLRALLPEEDEERGIVANRSLFPLSFSRVERASPADIECDQAPTGSGTPGRGQWRHGSIDGGDGHQGGERATRDRRRMAGKTG